MPEIKHQFTGGKMNKDLDERLVPNGQYVDAMNIQVTTSEGSDAGTVRNIMGNNEVASIGFGSETACIGIIPDETNKVIYYFLTNNTKSGIIEYNTLDGTISPVLIDVTNVVLEFSTDLLITGINIIDGMLFWTDNNSEPKKINIKRSKEGSSDYSTDTTFINTERTLNKPLKKEHVTVIKKAPLSAPIMLLESERDPSKTYAGIVTITSVENANNSSFKAFANVPATRNDFTGIKAGTNFTTLVETDMNGDSGFTLDWKIGDTVFLKEFKDDLPPSIPIVNPTIKAVIQSNHFRPSDLISEYLLNTNFETPDTNGDAPDGWKFEETVGIAYNFITQAVDVDGFQNRDALIAVNTTSTPIGIDDEFTFTFEISNVDNGEAALVVAIEDPNDSNKTLFWRTAYYNADGVYSETIKLTQAAINAGNNAGSISASASAIYASREQKPFIRFRKTPGSTGGNMIVQMTVNSVSLQNTNTANARVKLKVSSIDGIPQKVPFGETELKYAIDLGNKEDSLFEFKFARFATRYKYQDGEYSTFSTFSQPAFIPGTFDYHPKKGYNLAMRNRLKKITLKNLNKNIPHGVVSIDVLYKEESSTLVYLVETLKKDKWSQDYEIEAEAISSIIPSNQLLRPWDNVPRKALAQDVVGGRITYGNYLYQHDLVDSSGSDYFPNIDFNFESETLTSSVAKSVKSLREYQLGVVFVDKFGRETPVISSKSVSSKISKSNANKANVVSASFKDSNFVKDMKYFKFFIKETSGEYYNMAMDRYWDADDDHVWVSFPSSDRNKIDIDSFLILKKGIQTTSVVTEAARYKVIDIKSEAPDFIKIKKELIEKKQHVYGNEEISTNIFNNDLTGAPLSGRDSFQLNYGPFANSSGSELHEVKERLYVEFCNQTEENVSKKYRITSVTTDFKGFNDTGIDVNDAVYNFKLDKILGEDVNFIADSTGIKDTTIVKIYKYVTENTPEFDGRFFVKIVNDTTFQTNINENVTTSNSFRVLKTQKLYYMANDHETTHAAAITGHADGLYADKLGRYACYFRNYNYPEDGTYELNYTQIPYLRDRGRYKFGKANNNDWKNELLFTEQSAGAIGNISYAATTRDADSQSVDDSVWFIDEGTFEGSRSNFALHWEYIGNSNGSNGGITENGPNSFSTINLAFGGIYDDFEPTGFATNKAGFFDVGRSDGNQNHNDTPTKRLVEQLQPARKFRFREDPTNTIYTIQPTISFEQLLRHDDGGDPWNANTQQQARFSHNFTRNWKLRVANADASSPTPGKLVWDPTGGGARGPIENGLVLTINSMSTAVTGVGVVVGVDNLEGTHTDGSKHEITVGMMLTSHSSEASGDDTLTGIGDKDFLIIWKIEDITGGKALYLTGYTGPISFTHDMISTNTAALGEELIFKQPAMNGYSQWSENRINLNDPNSTIASNSAPALYAVGYHMEFVEAIVEETELPDNPAIWETEPKENVGLDVYYEASGLNAVELTDETISEAIPLGSTLSKVGSDIIPDGVTVLSINTSGVITLSESVLTGNFYLSVGDEVRISKADGSSIDLTITALGTITNSRTSQITVNTNLYGDKTTYNLNWSNCYSFGNGVESNRIGDNFNLPFISNGVKVSSTLEEGDYKEQRRKYGLIYSGLYNSISGINSLNQFIAAEKITKDVNPVYGSIQKLYQRNSDLVVFCENKVLKMLANKDAVFNADGNPQLTANNRVLGQTLPFSGEYGISRNPESFASDSYRAYFTDKTRGSVLRLSMDGLTPISSAGMKDWFKDNLKLNNILIGSYDDDKEEYNITLKDTNNTVSYKEEVKGWVSFKSFSSMDMGASCNNEYYTFNDSSVWKHNSDEVSRGSFYGEDNGCSISFVMNQEPSLVKMFNTLNYEGSQAEAIGTGFESTIDGWVVQKIETNRQSGSLLDFVQKEGRWFGYVSGDGSSEKNDTAASHVNGIGDASKVVDNKINYGFKIPLGISAGDKVYANAVASVKVLDVTLVGQPTGKYFWFNQEAMEVSRFNGQPYSSGVTVYIFKDTSAGGSVTEQQVEVKLFKDNGAFAQNDSSGNPMAYGRLSNASGYGDWVVGDVLFGNKIPVLLGVVESISSDRESISLENNINSSANAVEIDVNRIPLYTYYQKNQYIENSGVIGYYATINLENNSTELAEIFSFGSNVIKSS